MTESEWFSCANPHEMLAYLKEHKPGLVASVLARIGLGKLKARQRKLVLFACACCRRLWPHLPDEHCRQAVECAELHCDGLIGKKAYQQAVDLAADACLRIAQPRRVAGNWQAAAQAKAAEAVTRMLESDDPADDAAVCAKEAVRAWANRSPGAVISYAVVSPRIAQQASGPEAAWIAEGVAQCGLLRDLFGNPFRKETLDPAWRTPEATALAAGIIKDRAFTAIANLADVLESAGCRDREMLQHCREAKEHVRGCWVLDFILGRSS